MNLKQKDAMFLGRDVQALPLEIIGADGSYLFAKNGEKYIDFLMGWNVGNIGWGVKEILYQVKKYDGPDYVNPHYLFEPWAELAELLARITPKNLTKSFRATGGTEAVEIALQAAMAHTKRYEFVSVAGAYHGHSIGAMSLMPQAFGQRYPHLAPETHQIAPPLDENAALKIVKLIKSRAIAAFIAEPIIMNLGVVAPTQRFFDIVTAACKKYETLFIMDEVASGFGRTGKLFASQHFNLTPDIMCFAKGITGGYGALGATIMTEEVAESFRFPFSFYSTFGWYPRSTVAAIATINYILKHWKKISSNVDHLSSYFRSRLVRMKFKYPTDIRIRGLAIGIEFQKDGYNIELMQKAFKKNLLFSELGSKIITFFPSLLIDESTAKKGLDIFESCL